MGDPPAPERRRLTSPSKGVYGISVAAEIVGTGVQSLRLYEARGLLTPERTTGGTRRYSEDDVDRLHRIADLLAQGLNLSGVAMVLDLQDQNTALNDENTVLREEGRDSQRNVGEP